MTRKAKAGGPTLASVVLVGGPLDGQRRMMQGPTAKEYDPRMGLGLFPVLVTMAGGTHEYDLIGYCATGEMLALGVETCPR